MRALTKNDIALIRGGSGSVGDPLAQAYAYYDEAGADIAEEEAFQMGHLADLFNDQAAEIVDAAHGDLEAVAKDEFLIDRDLTEIGEDADNIAENQAVQAYWLGVIESLTGG
jgi:hypothetical protein